MDLEVGGMHDARAHRAPQCAPCPVERASLLKAGTAAESYIRDAPPRDEVRGRSPRSRHKRHETPLRPGDARRPAADAPNFRADGIRSDRRTAAQTDPHDHLRDG